VLGGISSAREIQLLRKDFIAVVTSNVASTIKTTSKPLRVPAARFWFPVDISMTLRSADLPITTETFRIEIIDVLGQTRYILLSPNDVNSLGAAIWPLVLYDQDSPAADSYMAKDTIMMIPGDGFRMSILNAVDDDQWFGRFSVLEVITNDPNRAYELYFQYTRGVRRFMLREEMRGARGQQ